MMSCLFVYLFVCLFVVFARSVFELFSSVFGWLTVGSLKMVLCVMLIMISIIVRLLEVLSH